MFYTALAVICAGLMFVGIFVLGMLFAVRLLTDAQEEAKYDRLRQEYYALAHSRNSTDPRPYVPPRSVVLPRSKFPRAYRILPGMSKLDRLMHEGKRGTIMWRAGDRQKAV